MTGFKLFPFGRILALALIFVISSFLVLPWHQAAQADVFTEVVARIQTLVNPPRGRAPTGRRVGGAGRGPICIAKNEQRDQSVQALMLTQPRDGQEKGTVLASSAEFVGGLTIAAQPTFWFYVPYVSAPETSPQRVAQFVLLDDANHPVWNELMNVELFAEPRLVEYLLPYKLETGKLHNWYFSVICDSEKLSRNPIVQGWIQRVDATPELQTALKNTSRFEQYLAYANHGLWFETVDSIVKIRRQFPSTNRDTWISLLQYFQIPEAVQSYAPAEPTEREVVNGNQLPVSM